MISDLASHARKEPWSVVLFFALVSWILFLSLTQGLTWDEPWLMGRAWDLLDGKPLEAFKPFSGLILAPLVKLGGSWMAGRILFVGVQILIGVALFGIMPKDWSPSRKLVGLTLLWMEPTFRERILEMRTDSLVLLFALGATLAWKKWNIKLSAQVASTSVCWALAILLSFKSILFWAPWLAAIFWVERERPIRQVSLELGLHVFATLILLSALLLALGWWFNIPQLGATLASGTPTLSMSIRENHGWISSVWRIYAPQIVLLGLPFWALALAGLALSAFRQSRPFGLWGAWEVFGWISLGISVFYYGAFPYHFVGIIAGLLPACLRGMDWLGERLRAPRLPLAAMAAGGLFSLFAAWPVLAGPTLQAQSALMSYVGDFAGSGRSYVDGAGMLPNQRQAAPFATGALLASGQAEDLWKRWEAEKASVFLLNGRTEMLFAPHNLDWLKKNVIRVHSQVLVVGTAGRIEDGSLQHEWHAPWGGEFLFLGTPGCVWTLDGNSILPGSRVQLKMGPHLIEGTGPRGGELTLLVSPRGGALPPRPAPVNPFYLPFQRGLF